jgi:hypothetical protein
MHLWYSTNHLIYSSLEWGQENETELLVGLRCQTVKVFDVADKTFTSCVNVKAGSGPLRGVAKFDDTLVTGIIKFRLI